MKDNKALIWAIVLTQGVISGLLFAILQELK